MATKTFLDAYIAAALWSSIDMGGDDTPLDEVDAELSEDAKEVMKRDCEAFQHFNKALLDQAREGGASEAQLGHDFWLTRNGHGAGFWDRDYSTKEVRTALTAAAHKVGGRTLYVSDAGEIEITNG